MPQTKERKRQARIERSACSNGHPVAVAAATMRAFEGVRVPLCARCDEALLQIVDVELAEAADKETRRQQERDARQDQELPRNGATWPCWALLRSQEAIEYQGRRELGPWGEATGSCEVEEGSRHDAEYPYVFHCAQHAGDRQGRTPLARPEPRRDKGLCIRCGRPAELSPGASGTHRELCIKAELGHSTVARLCTQRQCSDCKG